MLVNIVYGCPYAILGFSQQSAVQGGIIICALRSKDAAHCLEMAQLSGKYLQLAKNETIGVVGFDVAGDEGSYPINSYDCPLVQGSGSLTDFINFIKYYISGMV